MANGKRLVTEPSWCKGCGYCVHFCPKDVLALENEKVIVKNLAACTCCGFCELHCPDFAIWIEKEDKKDGKKSTKTLSTPSR